jgi:GTP cyclohydrolase II
MPTHENRARATAQTGALWRIASTRLPTRWGMFEAIGFERDVGIGGRTVETALALLLGDPRHGVPLLRVHSQCLTGEMFGSRVRLLTNNPRKMRALKDGGIEVVERLPCEIVPTAHSLAYLQTKKQKMGHALSLGIPVPGSAPRGRCDASRFWEGE